MRFLITTLTVAAIALSACGGEKAEINYADPNSVAETILTAARDRDLETLAYTFHPEHEWSAREVLLAALKEDDNPLNDFDPDEWDMFSMDEKMGRDIKAWNGYLEAPRYEMNYGQLVALYAFSKPDEYNDQSVIVLERRGDEWYFHDTWFQRPEDLSALASRPDDVTAD